MDYVHLDIPRASKSQQANLFSLGTDNVVVEKSYSLNDPDYITVFSANAIVATRLISKSLSAIGVITAVTDWFHYTILRTAFEFALGVENTLGELIYQTREGGGNDSRFMSIDHETLLIFSNQPSNVGRFTVAKDPEQLSKYNLEDENGRYTWDTYIRKQAKMYYPIECPDGTILELDEYGQRISWLRSKARFESDLKNGEIEFRKVNGNWRLYYKDRIKETKILRSVSLSKDQGEEIIENLNSETLKSLLTKHGASELKPFGDDKPKYLKSSKYYNFILSAFAKNAKAIFIPFPEHASAALAVSQIRPDSKFITSVSDQYEELWRARMADVQPSTSIVEVTSTSLPEIVCSLSNDQALMAYQGLVSLQLTGLPEFGVIEISGCKSLIGFSANDTLGCLIYVGDYSDFNQLFNKVIETNPNFSSMDNLKLYSTSDLDPDVLLKITQAYKSVDILQLPEDLL